MSQTMQQELDKLDVTKKAQVIKLKITHKLHSCLARDTFIAFLPLLFWWMIFQFYQFIPVEWRPSINTTFLPWLEQFLFGTQLWKLFPPMQSSYPLVDLFAATGYAIHFVAPWAFMLYLYVSRRNALAFIWCLGWLNAIAVFTHAFFPTSPPWYKQKFGLDFAHYAIKGDPAGLRNADSILHIHFFENVYTSSPVVFGSFPSLHAAWPFLMALFCNVNTVVGKAFWFYVAWVWWAAMYLQHHYMVDLLGGALYTMIVFYGTKAYYPKILESTSPRSNASLHNEIEV